jgi:PAT family beta-lactamase induction signal transducer AmpG
VYFYLLTTLVAFPGVILFWFMIRSGLADLSIGSAGKEGEGDARADKA